MYFYLKAGMRSKSMIRGSMTCAPAALRRYGMGRCANYLRTCDLRPYRYRGQVSLDRSSDLSSD
jgi:hypothetical protein